MTLMKNATLFRLAGSTLRRLNNLISMGVVEPQCVGNSGPTHERINSGCALRNVSGLTRVQGVGFNCPFNTEFMDNAMTCAVVTPDDSTESDNRRDDVAPHGEIVVTRVNSNPGGLEWLPRFLSRIGPLAETSFKPKMKESCLQKQESVTERRCADKTTVVRQHEKTGRQLSRVSTAAFNKTAFDGSTGIARLKCLTRYKRAMRVAKAQRMRYYSFIFAYVAAIIALICGATPGYNMLTLIGKGPFQTTKSRGRGRCQVRYADGYCYKAMMQSPVSYGAWPTCQQLLDGYFAGEWQYRGSAVSGNHVVGGTWSERRMLNFLAWHAPVRLGGNIVDITGANGYCWRELCLEPDAHYDLNEWPFGLSVGIWMLAMPQRLKTRIGIRLYVDDETHRAHVTTSVIGQSFEEIVWWCFTHPFYRIGGWVPLYPDGECYKCLTECPLELGRYPQGRTVAREYRDGVPPPWRFTMSFNDNRIHLAPSVSPLALTFFEVLELIAKRPEAGVGGNRRRRVADACKVDIAQVPEPTLERVFGVVGRAAHTFTDVVDEALASSSPELDEHEPLEPWQCDCADPDCEEFFGYMVRGVAPTPEALERMARSPNPTYAREAQMRLTLTGPQTFLEQAIEQQLEKVPFLKCLQTEFRNSPRSWVAPPKDVQKAAGVFPKVKLHPLIVEEEAAACLPLCNGDQAVLVSKLVAYRRLMAALRYLAIAVIVAGFWSTYHWWWYVREVLVDVINPTPMTTAEFQMYVVRELANLKYLMNRGYSMMLNEGLSWIMRLVATGGLIAIGQGQIMTANLDLGARALGTYFVMAFIGVYFLLWAAYLIFHPGNHRQLRFRFHPFGSRGDFVPLRFYYNLMTAYGFDTEWAQANSEAEGEDMLREIEAGDVFKTSGYLSRFMTRLQRSRIDEACYVFAPLGMLTKGPRTITYDLTPPAHVIEHYTLGIRFPWMRWFNSVTSFVFLSSRPDLRIGSFKGFAPRSCDGHNLLKVCRDNRARNRKTLITLGSSSLHEPEGLDKRTTWSTRPGTVYQYEPRTDHAMIMQEYEEVMCHGGAGTMATAAAAGARPISLSGNLDRTYIDVEQFDFATSVDIFWVAVIAKLNWIDTLKFLVHLWHVRGVRGLVGGFRWWCVAMWRGALNRGLRVAFLVIQLDLFLRTVAFQPTIEQMVHQILVPFGLHPFISYGIAVHLASTLILITRRKYYKYYVPDVLPLAIYSLPENLADPGFWFFMNVWGFIPAIFFYSYLDRFVQVAGYRMRWGAATVTAWWYHARRTDDRFLTIRFSKITGYFFALVPAYHVELVDPVSGFCVGVDNNDGTLHIYREQRTRRLITMELKTQIPRGRLGPIYERLRKKEGEVYTFRNTCQTSLWPILRAHEGDTSILMLMMGSLIALTTTMFFGVGYIALFMLGLAATFSGQAVMSSQALINIMYSAGAPDQRAQLGFAEVFAYLFGGSSENKDASRLYDQLKNAANPMAVLWDETKVVMGVSKRAPHPAPDAGPALYAIHGRETVVHGETRYVHRREELTGRTPEDLHFMHALSWDVRNDVYGLTPASEAFQEKWRLLGLHVATVVGKWQEQAPKDRPLRIAMAALSADLTADPKYVADVNERFDHVICFTNGDMTIPGWHVIRVEATGRQLACYRLLPFWLDSSANFYSINGRISGNMVKMIEAAVSIVEGELINTTSVASTCYGSTHSILAACFLNHRDKANNDGILGSIERWGHVYGTDEAVLVHKKMFVQHYFNELLFNFMSREISFTVADTWVRLVDMDGNVLGLGMTNHWCWDEVKRCYETPNTAYIPRGPPNAVWDVDDEGYPAMKVFGMTKSLKHVFEQVSVVLTGGPTPVRDLVTQSRRNISMFRRRLQQAREVLAGTQLAKAGRVITDEVEGAINHLLDVFGEPNDRLKKVWAPITRVSKYQKQLNKLQLKLSPDPRFRVMNYDETLAAYISHLNFNRGMNDRTKRRVEPLGFHDYTRALRRSPLVDTYLTERAKYYHANWEFPKGIDGMTTATKDIMVGSLARYIEPDAGYTITPGAAWRIAEAIVDHNPEMYLDAELSDPRKVLNKMVQKYSPSIPFIGKDARGRVRFRKRRDLRPEHWDNAIIKTVRHWLETGDWLPMLYHAFPKSQVVDEGKLVGDPFKLRSITGQNLLSYVQSMIFCMDVNKRRHWFEAPEKIGMPLNGAAMNFVFGKIAKRRNKVSLDITKMDANENAGIFEVLKRVRQRGFDNHPQRETIYKHIDCMYEAIKQGFIVNLVDEVAVIKKVRGGATGHSNVSKDNSIALQVIMMDALWQTHGITPERFFRECELVNQSDDNMFGTDLVLNWPKLFQYLEEHHHIKCRLEGSGDIFGQTFLGKRVEAGSKYAHDFRLIGRTPPAFAVIHDHKNMLMRYCDLKVEKTHRFRNAFERCCYMIERIQGDIALTAHQRKIYNAFREDYDHFVAQLPRTFRESVRFQKQYTLPTYETVLANWYKDFDPMVLNVFQRLRYSFIWADLAQYHMANSFRMLEKFGDALPVKLLSLDEPELFETPRFKSGKYEVERFLYYAAYHTNRVAPDLATLEYLSRQSPFSSFVDLPGFLNTPLAEVELDDMELDRKFTTAQNRMVMLGVIYLQINRLLDLLNMVPAGPLVSMLFTLYAHTVPKMYSMANFLHWIHKGASSPELSAMVPRDLYYNHKFIAIRILETCPVTVEMLMSIDRLLGITTWGMVKLSQVWQPSFGQTVEQERIMRPGNTSAEWVNAVDMIVPVLDNENVSISAPTGTGKSYFMPREFIGRTIRGVTIRQVLLLMPRRILCAEIGLPNIHWLKRGQVYDEKRRFITATYGHMLMRLRNKFVVPMDTLVLFDEAHEESPEMIAAVMMLLPANICVAATATPVFTNLPPLQHLELPVHRQYSTETVEMLGYDPLEALEWVRAERPNALSRILWIEPSLRGCEKIADSLAQHGVPVTLVHAQARNIPETGHIVATQIVDAGINIKGITCVIDAGESIVNHLGCISRIRSPAYVREQRKGRTGRFCDGLYISLCKPATLKPQAWPSVAQAVEDTTLCEMLHAPIKLNRRPLQSGIPLNQFAYFAGTAPEGYELKLTALWHHMTLDRDFLKAKQLWDRVAKGAVPEELEYALDQLELTSVPSYHECRGTLNRYAIRYETEDGIEITTPKWSASGLGDERWSQEALSAHKRPKHMARQIIEHAQ